MPAALYPSDCDAAILSRTDANVFSNPSLFAFATTAFTRSGRCRASCSKPLLTSSTEARSVPALINEATVRTSTRPRCKAGTGTSPTNGLPVLRFCNTCFIDLSFVLGSLFSALLTLANKVQRTSNKVRLGETFLHQDFLD